MVVIGSLALLLPPANLAHPESLPVRDPDHFVAVRAEVNIPLAKRGSHGLQPNRPEPGFAVWADGLYVFSFQNADHF